MTIQSEKLTMWYYMAMKPKDNNSFAHLFRKFRLRSEFSTLAELGEALFEKGLIYEDSIFSHWQKGDRIPNRATILKLIEIFLRGKA